MRGNWAETWTNLKLNPSQSRHRSEPQFNPPSEFYFNSFTTREGFSETISILICLLWIGIGVEYWKWYEMQFRPQNNFVEKCGIFFRCFSMRQIEAPELDKNLKLLPFSSDNQINYASSDSTILTRITRGREGRALLGVSEPSFSGPGWWEI